MTIAPPIQPPRLHCGDTVATVSLSWGGPACFPKRYAMGRQVLVERFGLNVVEMPHALREAAWLRDNPQARADDLMQAFADPSIRAVISTIGGEDSIRLLRFLDFDLLRAHPTIFLGYSDSTVSLWALHHAGIVSFYGPAVMAGFAETGGPFGYSMAAVERVLFHAQPAGVIAPSTCGWTAQRENWAAAAPHRPRRLRPAMPWRWLQGEGVVEGRLIGGCLEVVEFLRGSPVWPSSAQWDGAILFLETSEEAPAPAVLMRALRSYAAMGILSRLSAVLFGRPGGDVDPAQFADYDAALLTVIRDEEGLAQLPIITGMDFGHTDPMCVLPIGSLARIDCDRQTVALIEAAVS
ncbi:MAG TPA: LD-carboxypeptidase [Xanthomonadales bacterium]|nr:LD-carboxypeptidase [Xanthomonadales bacterium]